MIQYIKNIGTYVHENFQDNSAIDGMVNSIESKDMKVILIINVLPNGIEYKTKEFEKNITKEALFYQAGNGALGGGIRLDFYDQLDAKNEPKGRKKLKLACEFCEVENRYEEIKQYIEQYLKEKDKNTFAVIQVDGKMPIELFQEKFLKKMYATMYKSIKGEHICHLCGKKGQAYNTATYKFYTNDKEIYNNIDHVEKNGIVIGEECLNNIILGRKYVDQYLSSFWMGKKVMFLPHNYDEDAAVIYESSILGENAEPTNFINKIRLNEEDFIYEIGKTKAVTDIIFYEEDSKFFYINYVIQSVLPSRFSFIGNLLGKYELKLFNLIKYAAAVRISLDSIETTDKERIRILDAFFSGKRIERSLFFKRVMDVYKHYLLKDEHRKYACMKTINRIYNFLCECDCLEKGWNVLENYKNYEELFSKNEVYFDTNEKKAWFILGKAYSTMIYLMRQNKNKNDEASNENDRTSLEKNFFFARKFDFNDFIYFANLLTDKAIKYRADRIFFKKMMTEAKDYMAKQEGRLGCDEAKYLFFWGADAYFASEKDDQQEVEEE